MSDGSAGSGHHGDSAARGDDAKSPKATKRWPAPKKKGVVLNVIVGCSVDALFEGFAKQSAKDGSLWAQFMRFRKYENERVGAWREGRDKVEVRQGG